MNRAAFIAQLEDWARTLDHAQTFLARGQYGRVYEATFRTAVAMRDVAGGTRQRGQGGIINRAERVLAFLEHRYPGWVPAIELEPVGGRQAWRTAVSEARQIVQQRGDDIENRTQLSARVSTHGPRYTISEYRLKKHAESAPVQPSEAHDLNVFELR